MEICFSVRAENGDIHKLRRAPNAQKQYEVWKTEQLEKFGSLNDMLRNKIFGHDLVKHPATGKLVVDSRSTRRERVVIRENDFPYDFEANIDHHVIWFESHAPPTDACIKDAIAGCFLSSRPSCFWVNPPHLRSVEGLHHAHVLSLRNGALY